MSNGPLGATLRKLRLERKLPLRKVAVLLDIDVAILSKMERGERKLTKDVVLKLAEIYDHDPKEFMVQFLSEKIIEAAGQSDLAAKAFHLAEAQVAYGKTSKSGIQSEMRMLKEYFQNDSRVTAAWLYGSFARGEATDASDIDIMIRFDKEATITLFDIADITYELELLTKRKIDLVEEGCLRPYALKTAEKDLIKIYG